MKKRFLAFIICTMSLASVLYIPSFSYAYYEEEYICSYSNFENGIISDNELTVDGTYEIVQDVNGSKGNSLKLSDGFVDYTQSEGTFGKKKVSFLFSENSGNAEFKLFGRNIGDTSVYELINCTYDGKTLTINETEAGYTFSYGVWYTAEFYVNTINKSCEFVLYANDEAVYSHIEAFESELFCGVSISSDGELYVDDLTVKGVAKAPLIKPVVNKYGDIYSASVKLQNTKDTEVVSSLYLCLYEGNRLKDIKVIPFCVLPHESKIVEGYIKGDGTEDETAKAYVFDRNDIYPLTHIGEISDNTLFQENFDNSQNLPSGWRGIDRQTTHQTSSQVGITSDEGSSLSNSAYIPAIEGGQRSLVSPAIPFDENVWAYRISFKHKTTVDYQGNSLRLRLLFYNDSTLLTSVAGNVFLYPETSHEDWIEYSGIIYPNSYPDLNGIAGDVTMRMDIHTAYEAGSASGMVYVDDVRVDVPEPDRDVIINNMTASDDKSWYIKGETVTYKAEKSFAQDVKTITGTVYDSSGEVVESKSVSAKTVTDSGWNWTNNETGFYTVRFTADTNLISIPVASMYQLPDKSVIYSDVRSFAYAHSPKDITERNQNQFASYSYANDNLDILELCDEIGFSGVRIHPFPWGEYPNSGGHTAINSAEGKFDWSWSDKVVNKINELGFRAIANIMYTPKWASPSDSQELMNGYNIYEYSTYAPENMEALSTFLSAVADRYGDTFDIWEIYNEPHLPGYSVFWSDTPQNYAQLLKTAYTAIKTADSSDIVTIGGIGNRYYSFFKELISTTDAYNYFDYYAMHGKNIDIRPFNRLAKQLGYASKPYYDTEGHFVLVNASDSKIDYTEQETAFNMLQQYFKEAKYGAEITTFFRIRESRETEMLPYGRENGLKWKSYGLFRQTPMFEPRLCAMVLNNYFNMMGKDFSYNSEFILTDDGQHGVAFNNDGNITVAVWNENSNFEIASALKRCFTNETQIINWEGQNVSSDSTLKAQTVYFVKGIDVAKLSDIEKTDYGVIYLSGDKSDISYSPDFYGNIGALYDREIYEISSDILWCEDEFEASGTTDGGARFAVGFGEDELDIIVEVEDSSHYCTDSSKYSSNDSLVIDIDANGNKDSDSNVKIAVSLNSSTNKASMIKVEAPDISGMIPSDWTDVGKEIQNKNLLVKNSGGVTTYMMTIKYSELYPYYFDFDNGINMKLTVNDKDNKWLILTSFGSKSWHNGEIESGYNTIATKSRVYTNINDEGKRVFFGITTPNSYMALTVYDNEGNFVGLSQVAADSEGKFEAVLELPASGKYTVKLGGQEFEGVYVADFSYLQS